MKNKINSILSCDFERDLFDACLRNLDDKDNKLRFNNFAYSIRELSRHFLHSLAPDEKIKKCCWYKKETDNDKPTRAQRAKYAIQGGFSDELLENLGIDVDEKKEVIKSVVGIITDLSKYTHIEPHTFGFSDAEVESKTAEILRKFASLVETITDARKKFTDALEGVIETDVASDVASNPLGEIVVLSTSYTLHGADVSDYDIVSINDSTVTVEVNGTVSVTLEYGPKGDTHDVPHSFPFTTTAYYKITPNEFPSHEKFIEEFVVDTSDNWLTDE